MDNAKKTILVLGRMRGILIYLYENPEADLSGALYYLNHTRAELQRDAPPRDILQGIRKIPREQQQGVFERLKKLLREAEMDFPSRIIWKFSSETYPYQALWDLLNQNDFEADIDRRTETLMRNPTMMHRNNLTTILEHLEIRRNFEIVW
jgi:hypothetical protein